MLILLWHVTRIICSPMGQKVMNEDGGHFIRKSSFVDQHRWPFSWHFPVCIVLWGMSALFLAFSLVYCFMGLVSPFFGIFPCALFDNIGGPFLGIFPCALFYGACRPFFGIFPCALFDGAYKELLFIWIIYSPMGQKVMNEDGGHFIRKSSFVDQHRWPSSWHFPVCIVLWGLPRIIVYFKLYLWHHYFLINMVQMFIHIDISIS